MNSYQVSRVVVGVVVVQLELEEPGKLEADGGGCHEDEVHVVGLPRHQRLADGLVALRRHGHHHEDVGGLDDAPA